ncbi:MAG: hypothetical protein L0346_12910 [Chloroflexi bacterium]|nr:hypothetical protein [Chloroflexota bacterium]
MIVEERVSQPKVGGGQTVRLFLKGNEDLVASLLARPEGGTVLDHAFRDWVGEKYDGTVAVQITHEPCWRADLLLQQLEGVSLPDELRQQGLDDDFIAAQFQSRLLEGPVDVVALSLQPEIAHELWQHRQAGYLLYPPPGWEQRWSPAQRRWFQEQFTPRGHITVAEFRQSFTRLVRYLKDELKAQVIVYGCASFDPDDTSHNYYQVADTLALRAHRFNLALIELSRQEGISLVDVDRLLAELGGRAHVRRVFEYSPEAYQAIGREFLRIVEDSGFFEQQALLWKLVLPQLERQFQGGSIIRWHKQEGEWVSIGDNLFDLRVEEFKRLKRLNAGQPEKLQAAETNTRDWAWLVRVVSANEGFLRKKYVAEEAYCTVEDLLAVLSAKEAEPAELDEQAVAAAPSFRVVANSLEGSI